METSLGNGSQARPPQGRRRLQPQLTEEVEMETTVQDDWKVNLPKATRDLLVMQIIDVLKVTKPRYRSERSYLIIGRRIENRCFKNAKDKAHYSDLIDTELMSEEEVAAFVLNLSGAQLSNGLEPQPVDLCTPLQECAAEPPIEELSSAAEDNTASKRPNRRRRKPRNPVRSPLQ